MKVKIPVLLMMSALFWGAWLKPAFALEHIQKNGLFSMDIPGTWHWIEYPNEIVITYPDGKTMAMDIQLVPSLLISQADIKKAIKEGNDHMIKEGVTAHGGAMMGNKEITIDGAYAARLDFKTAPPNSMAVTYISVFNKGFAITATYGSGDDKMHSVLDDVFATFKLK